MELLACQLPHFLKEKFPQAGVKNNAGLR